MFQKIKNEYKAIYFLYVIKMYNQLLEYLQKDNSETECEHVVTETPTPSVKPTVNIGYTSQDVNSQEKFNEWYKNVHLC